MAAKTGADALRNFLLAVMFLCLSGRTLQRSRHYLVPLMTISWPLSIMLNPTDCAETSGNPRPSGE